MHVSEQGNRYSCRGTGKACIGVATPACKLWLCPLPGSQTLAAFFYIPECQSTGPVQCPQYLLPKRCTSTSPLVVKDEITRYA